MRILKSNEYAQSILTDSPPQRRELAGISSRKQLRKYQNTGMGEALLCSRILPSLCNRVISCDCSYFPCLAAYKPSFKPHFSTRKLSQTQGKYTTSQGSSLQISYTELLCSAQETETFGYRGQKDRGAPFSASFLSTANPSVIKDHEPDSCIQQIMKSLEYFQTENLKCIISFLDLIVPTHSFQGLFCSLV